MTLSRIIFAALIVAASTLRSTIVSAQQRTGEDLVQTELLANVASIQPGQSFKLGLRFTIEPGWHIYWINPGDSGQPPEAKWHAPDGFAISALQFPIPKRFDQAGDLVGYGYEREIMFIVDATAPKNVKPGSTISISADVSWLVCEDVCLPGKRTISIDVPVSDQSAPANVSAFDEWVTRQPVRGTADVSKLGVSDVRPARDVRQQFTVDWNPQVKAEKLEWFPPPSQEIEFSRIDVKTSGATTSVHFVARPMGRMNPNPGTIDSVLAYTVDGQRKGLVVPIKIVAESALSAPAAKTQNR